MRVTDPNWKQKLRTRNRTVWFSLLSLLMGYDTNAVAAFLSEYDFSGKTIVPFCKYEGSRLGQSVTDITKLCPQSTILDGLASLGRDIKNAQNEVSKWLRKIGMIE